MLEQIQKRSTNRQLLQYMQKHFADKAEIELVEIKDIPVFNKPADKQVPHHDAIIADMDKSYTEYKGRIQCKKKLVSLFLYTT